MPLYTKLGMAPFGGRPETGGEALILSPKNKPDLSGRMLWVAIASPLSPCPQILWVEMKGMKILQTIVFAILGLGLIGVVYFLGVKQIHYNAVDKCLASGKTQFVRDGQNLSGPDGYWFQFCMKEKGLK